MEDSMKKNIRTSMTALAATLLATPALAETAARSDKSSLMIWAFLGVCALIVVVQVIPSLFSLRDTARQAKKDSTQVAVKSTVKH
jgi:hypothetical protein